VVLTLDSDLQEAPIPKDANLRIPKVTLDAHPQGDSASVNAAAKMLVDAENPVVVAGRVARTPEGQQHLIAFVEALQVPVVDQGGNLPTGHPLGGGGAAVRAADVILALDADDLWGTLHTVRDQVDRTSRSVTKPGVKLISISTNEVFTKSNYQNFQRFQDVDI